MGPVIAIRGAREHNLKNISLDIPRNKLVVITGLSGSGKSTLAFDTIYAEGQRRYIESLSSYARQYLEKLKKPDVDTISGLSPAISIDQKSFTHNPRSTVATVTEIYDYLRLLYAKVGELFCYRCGERVGSQSMQEIVAQLLSLAEKTHFSIFAPLVRGRKGEYRKLFETVRKKGFAKVRVDGVLQDLTAGLNLARHKRHDIELLVDTLQADPHERARIVESLALAFELARGVAMVTTEERKPRTLFFARERYCAACDVGYPAFTPNMFSFNSPYGACPKCRGIGRISLLLSRLVIEHPGKPLLKGALSKDLDFSFNKYFIENLAWELKDRYRVDLARPFETWPDDAKDAFFWGGDDFDGLFDELRHLFYHTSSTVVKEKVRKFIREDVCPECRGGRLRKEHLGVRVGGANIVEANRMTCQEALDFFAGLSFTGSEAVVAQPILLEIVSRLKFLLNVGLSYLTLERSVTSLAGGELQRIRLAGQIGVGLSGVLYVLDEPSIGLHPRDHEKLLATLLALRDMRNTVIVVEHDEATMRAADYIVDLGPRGGVHGGEVTATGTIPEVIAQGDGRSSTARYLAHKLRIPLPAKRLPYRRRPSLRLRGARQHNLKAIDVTFPLGCFICVTGVSGSGKSTLVHDTLFRALHNRIWKTHYPVGAHGRLEGAEAVDRVVEIDQSPIGRTPRSNPVTYTDLFVHMRRLFASLPEAKLRNFTASRFSFNLKGGRCETCQGEGYQRLEMSFLPDVFVLCEDCRGTRYNEATLEVRYRGKTIAEVLAMSVEQALDCFHTIPVLREKLALLQRIGLGYITLGQSSTTLSGGEAQRVKLAAELSKRATGRTVYMLDEPTTGLHVADIEHLLAALFDLRAGGNTVIVIEHNLEMVKMADYCIDLGPEGGEAGGEVVATGSPEELAGVERSYTGQFLRRVLSGG